MEKMNLILCGLGGQGILFMTRILAETALRNGFQVIGAETHGMAQRGGSVISHLKLGPSMGSLVRTGTADILMGLDEKEAYRNLAFLKPQGKIYVNAPSGLFPDERVRGFLEKRGVTWRAMPVEAMAMELGAPRATNLGLLGLFAAFEDEPLGAHELRKTVEEITPPRFRELNLKVFEACRERASTLS